MKLYRPLAFLLLTVISFPIQAGNGSGNGFCDIRNTAFHAAETLTYKVFYTVVGAYFGAGEATFRSNIEQLNNKPVYHIIGRVKPLAFMMASSKYAISMKPISIPLHSSPTVLYAM
ncbi:hypothetical protein [Paraflavitalea speifideaquila]|uniref:hypothetical protein n=1 Tax=Paraflavitalea speifideaquila TaxID=3076558 RepID=UPI0028F0F47F|nr:hypothetical protein [Paraflavitalea speifideiaquila]